MRPLTVRSYLSDIVNYVDKDTNLTYTGEFFTVDIAETDVRRWELLSKDGGRYWDGKLGNVESVSDILLSDRVRNVPRFGGIRQDKALYIGLAITGFIYGGLHCLARSAPFATRAEAVLWRVSSIAIMSTFLLVLLLYIWEDPAATSYGGILDSAADFWDFLRELSRFLVGLMLPKKWSGGLRSWWDSCRRIFRYSSSFLWKPFRNISCCLLPPWVEKFFDEVMLVRRYFVFLLYRLRILLFELLVAAAILSYCLARVYLVVECFINLSHLPESVFRVPVWSQYVPHIS